MKYLVKNKWWKLSKEYNVDKLLYLLTDRPDHINGYNEFAWFQFMFVSRNYNLPAQVTNHYDVYWTGTGRQILNLNI